MPWAAGSLSFVNTLIEIVMAVGYLMLGIGFFNLLAQHMRRDPGPVLQLTIILLWPIVVLTTIIILILKDTWKRKR